MSCGGILLESTRMARPRGQELLSAWVPAETAAAFKAWARTHGSASAALRRIVADAVGAAAPAAPAGVGRGAQVSVRFKPEERLLLDAAARAHGTGPATWLRALAVVHLARRPQWSPAEAEALREVARELRAIGNNANQIARALNVAVETGEYAPEQGTAAREAAEAVRVEMRRVVAALTGNFDYWGLPDEERPRASAEGLARAERDGAVAVARRRGRARRRPARFAEAE